MLMQDGSLHRWMGIAWNGSVFHVQSLEPGMSLTLLSEHAAKCLYITEITGGWPRGLQRRLADSLTWAWSEGSCWPWRQTPRWGGSSATGHSLGCH